MTSLSDKIHGDDISKSQNMDFIYTQDVRDAVRELKDTIIKDFKLAYRPSINIIETINKIFEEKLI